MNDVISKELLSEVLQKDLSYILDPSMIISIYKVMGSRSILRYTIKRSVSNNHESINIHELAHKCKEWAYKQGYILMSTIRTNSSLAICEFSKSGKHDYEDELYNNFRAHTEHEAVFLACKWILENNTTRDNV